MRRHELLAYLVGAGVAGSLLVFPYLFRPLLAVLVPGVATVSVPFFLLPLAWGLWSWIHARYAPTIDVGLWGSLLGLTLGLAVNAFLAAHGLWFPAAAALPAFLGIAYFLLWRFIVGPLTAALDVRVDT